MIKLIVIADDLTGAMDTGVQFSKHNIRTLVTMDYQLHSLEKQKNAQVLVVDTETRHLPPREAYERCFHLVKLAKSCGISYFYKKTDSTLRGNIGAELTAAMDALGETTLYFAPAFPKQRRTCKNGKLYVDGLPLEQSIFARDPFTPIQSSSIAEIIQLQADDQVMVVNKSQYYDAEQKAGKKQIIVLDAQSEDDLQNICKQIAAEHATLLAGSAGLAELLPAIIPFIVEQKDDNKIPTGEKTLVICGSINEISLRQVQLAEQAGYPSVLLNGEVKQNPHFIETQGGALLCKQIGRLFASSNTVILKSLQNPQALCDAEIGRWDDAKGKRHIEIAMNIGRLIRILVMENEINNLIVFGGDTLFGILSSQMSEYVYPNSEILPGVVQSSIVLSGKRISLFTKAGGFGEDTTLLEILQNSLLACEK